MGDSSVDRIWFKVKNMKGYDAYYTGTIESYSDSEYLRRKDVLRIIEKEINK